MKTKVSKETLSRESRTHCLLHSDHLDHRYKAGAGRMLGRIYDSAGTTSAGSRNYPQAIAISDAESARLPVRRERAGRRPSRPQARRGNGSYSRLLDRR